jgi:CelD/BcsL family acetyltransferase involved in cellulose biosynthesis
VLATSDTALDAFWLLATASDGSYLGGLPLIRQRRLSMIRFLSMPYGTYGGLLSADDDEAVEIELLRGLKKSFEETKSLSFTCAPPPGVTPWPERLLEVLGAPKVLEMSTHILKLDGDFEKIWSGYQKRNRNIIRKAIKAGTDVSVVSGPKAATTLHGLYSAQARAWRDHKPYKYRLLEGCATYEGRAFTQLWQAVIGGSVHSSLLAFYDDREVFPWLMGSTPECRKLGVNNYLVSEIIRDACNRGLERVNLGGSLGDPGIEHFKRALGAVKTPVYHYIWDGRFFAFARKVRNALRSKG